VVIAVGHADRIGSDAYNMKLSVRRADSVKAISSARHRDEPIYTEGKGERQPVKELQRATRRPRADRVPRAEPPRRDRSRRFRHEVRASPRKALPGRLFYFCASG